MQKVNFLFFFHLVFFIFIYLLNNPYPKHVNIATKTHKALTAKQIHLITFVPKGRDFTKSKLGISKKKQSCFVFPRMLYARPHKYDN